MFKNILVPLDESDLSERALPVAKKLAGQFGATIHLLEAVQPQAELFSGPDSVASSQYDVAAMRNSAEVQVRSARTYLANIARICMAERLTVRVREATAPDSIKAYASENDIDLIVIGTHGRGGIQRMLVGSVTDRVVRSVGVPVLVIPRGKT